MVPLHTGLRVEARKSFSLAARGACSSVDSQRYGCAVVGPFEYDYRLAPEYEYDLKRRCASPDVRDSVTP